MAAKYQVTRGNDDQRRDECADAGVAQAFRQRETQQQISGVRCARSKRIGWDSAERHRLCVNHSYKTGINIAASLHFVAALPNTHYFEYCVEQGALRQTLTKQRFPVVDGDITVPEEPGLGIELDEAVVARYRVG